MEINSLIERFEHYAVNLKEIAHSPSDRLNRAFAHTEIEQIQEMATSGLKFPALLILSPEIEKMGDYDNLSAGTDIIFIVLTHARNQTQSQLQDIAKKIADKIYNRLLVDISERDDIYGVMDGTSEGVYGPILDNVYGWAVSVTITSPYDGELIDSDWFDLEGGTP